MISQGFQRKQNENIEEYCWQDEPLITLSNSFCVAKRKNLSHLICASKINWEWSMKTRAQIWRLLRHFFPRFRPYENICTNEKWDLPVTMYKIRWRLRKERTQHWWFLRIPTLRSWIVFSALSTEHFIGCIVHHTILNYLWMVFHITATIDGKCRPYSFISSYHRYDM